MNKKRLKSFLDQTQSLIGELEDLVSMMARDPEIDPETVSDFENILDGLESNYSAILKNMECSHEGV